LVFNKVDRLGREAGVEHDPCGTLSRVFLSAVTGAGVDELREVIADRARAARTDDGREAAVDSEADPSIPADVSH
jgi:GTPase